MIVVQKHSHHGDQNTHLLNFCRAHMAANASHCMVAQECWVWLNVTLLSTTAYLLMQDGEDACMISDLNKSNMLVDEKARFSWFLNEKIGILCVYCIYILNYHKSGYCILFTCS